ncbi:hypothetical protein [Rubritalea tangerina]|uniref:hypothetical protein n=1 Tax=Rubritalea tangerina TaxID=430798 RepID=UPI003619A2B2
MLDAFQVTEEKLENLDGGEYAKFERDGKCCIGFARRNTDLFWSEGEENVIVHRVFHKNTFSDFFFRSKMPVSEDED